MINTLNLEAGRFGKAAINNEELHEQMSVLWETACALWPLASQVSCSAWTESTAWRNIDQLHYMKEVSVINWQ